MTESEGSWRWPEMDHATAAPLLVRCLSVPVRNLIPLGAGDHCLAFKVGRRVVRVATNPDASAALKREEPILAAIADELPLPVPRPTYYPVSACPPFAVHDLVDGEPLTRDGWLNLRGPARDAIARDLAGFLDALHALPVAAAGNAGLPQRDARSFACLLMDRVDDSLGPMLDRATRARLETTLGRWASSPAVESPSRALLHGDISPGHLLFDPMSGRLTGIIDFGDLAIGEPARDFIYLYEDFGSLILTEVLRHYPTPKSGNFLDEIRKWYLLETITWTLTMHESRRQAEREHGIAEIARELSS